jgi:exodeoxyribonuclease VII large subunit
MITLQRRYPSAQVILYPVLVQGKGAAPSIVKAINNLNRMGEADVLIVGRGGGSLEELWAFNEEIVARAIVGSAIPVISAVGHETDFTIADFAADLRAATPTAAAELAVPNRAELLDQIAQRQRQLQHSLRQRAVHNRERLARLQRSPVLVHPRRTLMQHTERLDMLQQRLLRTVNTRMKWTAEKQERLRAALQRFNPREQVNAARRENASARRQLEVAIRSITRAKQQQWKSSVRHLDALSPLKVMSRGYSLVYDEQEQRLIKSMKDVQPGDSIKIKLTDGQLDCQVWGMKEDDNTHGE